PKKPVPTAPAPQPVIKIVDAEPDLVTPRNSVTKDIPVGSAPPSPAPARKRKSVNSATLVVKARMSVNTEKSATANIMTRRRPNLSVKNEMTSAPIIIPMSPEVDTKVASAGPKLHRESSIMEGIATPRTTRSKPSSSKANQHKMRMIVGFLEPRGRLVGTAV